MDVYTELRMANGVLFVHLEDDGQSVNEGKWKRAILPGIAMLRSHGGGGMIIPHRAHELT